IRGFHVTGVQTCALPIYALAGIEGIETLQSRSRNGRASVTLEFTLGRDIEAAANDVRDAISGVADRMPDEADPPEVEKADSDSEIGRASRRERGWSAGAA